MSDSLYALYIQQNLWDVLQNSILPVVKAKSGGNSFSAEETMLFKHCWTENISKIILQERPDCCFICKKVSVLCLCHLPSVLSRSRLIPLLLWIVVILSEAKRTHIAMGQSFHLVEQLTQRRSPLTRQKEGNVCKDQGCINLLKIY